MPVERFAARGASVFFGFPNRISPRRRNRHWWSSLRCDRSGCQPQPLITSQPHLLHKSQLRSRCRNRFRQRRPCPRLCGREFPKPLLRLPLLRLPPLSQNLLRQMSNSLSFPVCVVKIIEHSESMPGNRQSVLTVATFCSFPTSPDGQSLLTTHLTRTTNFLHEPPRSDKVSLKRTHTGYFGGEHVQSPMGHSQHGKN